MSSDDLTKDGSLVGREFDVYAILRVKDDRILGVYTDAEEALERFGVHAGCYNDGEVALKYCSTTVTREEAMNLDDAPPQHKPPASASRKSSGAPSP